jgi:peptidoglycan hydrolase-like protein with peptidoglycan-binding domain
VETGPLTTGATRTSRTLRNCLLVAVVAVTALLSLPGTSFAENNRGDRAAASAAVLRSGGTLVRGEGYGVVHGSPAVRALQLRLRARGFRPGPIDGLYGPLTSGAVRRFQRKHELVVDGIVGPQTRKPLLVQPAARREQPDPRRPVAANPNRPEPAPPEPAPPDPAPKQPPIALDVPPASAPQADVPAAPSSNSGISPWLAAALGALGAGLALGAFRLRASRRRGGPKRGAHVAPRLGPSDRRLSLGMVCAAMLAVFAVGAAVGALFAANAADDERASASEPRAALPLAQSSAGGGAVVKGERRPQRSLVAGSARERLGHP